VIFCGMDLVRRNKDFGAHRSFYAGSTRVVFNFHQAGVNSWRKRRKFSDCEKRTAKPCGGLLDYSVFYGAV